MALLGHRSRHAWQPEQLASSVGAVRTFFSVFICCLPEVREFRQVAMRFFKLALGKSYCHGLKSVKKYTFFHDDILII
jgi:hypothetical protein